MQRSSCLVLTILVLVACSSSAVAQAISFTGQGSSLAAPIYSSWAFDYQLVREDVHITYTSSSSGKGITGITTNQNNFGASDNPLTSSQRSSFPDLIQFPTVSAAVVMAFNFPGLSDSSTGSNLVLSRDVLARIYLGDITHWNDTDLVNSQPDLSVRAILQTATQAIRVGARKESSGTTGILTSCLSAFYPPWNQRFPSSFNMWTGSGVNANVSARAADPNFYLADQNFGVAGFVEVTPYSLGYIAYPTIARETIFTLADMINKNGDRVSANPPNLRAALANPTFDSNLVSNDLIDSSASMAWPMGGPTYVVLRTGTSNPSDCQSQRELLLFWKWTLSSSVAQLRLTFDGYSSLGEKAHDLVFDFIESIECPSTGASLLANQSLPQHTNKGATIALITVFELAGVVVTAGVVYYLIRDYHRIPPPALFFFCALLAGAILNYVSLGWFYLVPSKLWVCQVRQWFVAVGFSVVFAAVFVRAFQIRSILVLAKSSKILASKRRQWRSLFTLIGTFVGIVLAQVIILILWSSIDPWKPVAHQVDDLRGTFTWICSSKTNWVWFGLEIGFFALLLAFGWYVVYRTWDMKHLVIESKYIAVSVYNSIVAMVIVIVLFSTLASNDNVVYYISVVAIGFLTSMLLIALMGPKLLRVSDPSISATNTTTGNFGSKGSRHDNSKQISKGASKGSKGSKDSKDSEL